MTETVHLWKLILDKGKDMHFWKALQLQEGKIYLDAGYNFFSLLKQFVQKLCSFNTSLINIRSPLQGLLVLKINLIRYFFSDTVSKVTLPLVHHINLLFH